MGCSSCTCEEGQGNHDRRKQWERDLSRLGDQKGVFWRKLRYRGLVSKPGGGA